MKNGSSTKEAGSGRSAGRKAGHTQRKSRVAVIVLAACTMVSGAAQAAALNAGDVLTIGAGSWFAFPNQSSEVASIVPGTDGGIVIGSGQAPGAIDSWVYSGYLSGNHYTTTPITGSTEAGLDFSGWNVLTDGETTEGYLYEGAWTPSNCDELGCTGVVFADHIAAFAWSGVYGDSYSLWYSWSFNPTPGCFGCTSDYLLHLEGVVSAVPVPPAVWLFGSGLLALGTGRLKRGVLRSQ